MFPFRPSTVSARFNFFFLPLLSLERKKRSKREEQARKEEGGGRVGELLVYFLISPRSRNWSDEAANTLEHSGRKSFQIDTRMIRGRLKVLGK